MNALAYHPLPADDRESVADVREYDDDEPDTLPMTLTHNQRKAYRQRLLEHDPHCIYCGKKLRSDTSTLEHAIPESQGGPHTPWNLFLACAPCNSERSSQSLKKMAGKLRREAEELREKAARIEVAGRRMGLLSEPHEDDAFDHSQWYDAGGVTG